jgi:hypothetical protein
MKIEQIEGLIDEINQMFPDYLPQTEDYRRLIETDNHTSLPKCRNCQNLEDCLENGPMCPAIRKTAIK